MMDENKEVENAAIEVLTKEKSRLLDRLHSEKGGAKNDEYFLAQRKEGILRLEQSVDAINEAIEKLS